MSPIILISTVLLKFENAFNLNKNIYYIKVFLFTFLYHRSKRIEIMMLMLACSVVHVPNLGRPTYISRGQLIVYLS